MTDQGRDAVLKNGSDSALPGHQAGKEKTMQTSPIGRRVATVAGAGAILVSLAVAPATAGHGYSMTQESFEATLDRLQTYAGMTDMSERTDVSRVEDGVMRHPLRGDFPQAKAGSAPSTADAPNGQRVLITHPLRGDFPFAAGDTLRTE